MIPRKQKSRRWQLLVVLIVALTLYLTAGSRSVLVNGSYSPVVDSDPLSTAKDSPSIDLNTLKTSPHPIFLYDTPLALSPHDHFLMARPLAMENITWMTADYRYGYFVKESKTLHTGLDIPAEEGSPVFATADGEVIFSGYGILYGSGAKNDPYGIVVKIRHTQKFNNLTLYSMYAHLGRTAVKVGDRVTAGQTVGYVGMTGNTSGPHLHYETRILGENGQVTQNPELWLVPPLDHGVLAGRIMNNNGNLLHKWTFVLTSVETGHDWIISTYDSRILLNHQNDPYFKENYVFNDLPAGKYQFSMWYNYVYYTSTIEIYPGVVNYVNFEGNKGFQKGYPPGSNLTDFLN